MRRTVVLFLVTLAHCFCQWRVNAAAFIDAHRPPPIGATYEKSVQIPVLGRQVFSLHILSDNTAHLLVKGMLFLDELVTYTVSKRGCLNCNLSENAILTMRKVRASLKEVGYDRETDTPYVKVSTPLPVPVKINLKRKSEFDELKVIEERDELAALDGKNQLLMPH